VFCKKRRLRKNAQPFGTASVVPGILMFLFGGIAQGIGAFMQKSLFK
jgi:hypothetical protein